MEIEGNIILITGGAGFIGSHIVDRLIEENAKKIIVYDNFSTGKKEYINKKLVLSIGRLVPQKNFINLLNAIMEIRNEINNAVFDRVIFQNFNQYERTALSINDSQAIVVGNSIFIDNYICS